VIRLCTSIRVAIWMAHTCALASTSPVKVAAATALLPRALPHVQRLLSVPSPEADGGRPAQPIVKDLDGGYAVAWQRIADAVRAGTSLSSARYFLALENVAVVDASLGARSGPLLEVACGVLFDTWHGTSEFASSKPVIIPAPVSDAYWRRVDAFSVAAQPLPEARSWTLGRAAVEVLAPSPGLAHNDWIGAQEVVASQGDGGAVYAGRQAQLEDVVSVLFAALLVRVGKRGVTVTAHCPHPGPHCIPMRPPLQARRSSTYDARTAAVAAVFGRHAHRGVDFVDVTPILVDHKAALLQRAAEVLVPFVRLLRAANTRGPQRRLATAGISTRGYLFAPYIALALEQVDAARALATRCDVGFSAGAVRCLHRALLLLRRRRPWGDARRSQSSLFSRPAHYPRLPSLHPAHTARSTRARRTSASSFTGEAGRGG
jgi:hypothetical protein